LMDGFINQIKTPLEPTQTNGDESFQILSRMNYFSFLTKGTVQRLEAD
jgi:hypothetical protein